MHATTIGLFLAATTAQGVAPSLCASMRSRFFQISYRLLNGGQRWSRILSVVKGGQGDSSGARWIEGSKGIKGVKSS